MPSMTVLSSFLGNVQCELQSMGIAWNESKTALFFFHVYLFLQAECRNFIFLPYSTSFSKRVKISCRNELAVTCYLTAR